MGSIKEHKRKILCRRLKKWLKIKAKNFFEGMLFALILAGSFVTFFILAVTI